MNIWRNGRTGRSKAKSKTKLNWRRSALGTRIEALEARELLTVSYNGGGVLPNVQAQAVYLGSQWANASMSSQIAQTDQFLSTLVGTGSPYMSMLTNAGYGVGAGSDAKGVVDSNPTIAVNTSVTLRDGSIQEELASLVNQGIVQAPGQNNLYMVYVEPGVAVSMGGSSSTNYFLGYHSAFQDGGNVIHYAVMPYPGSPNPSSSSQGFSSTFNEETAVSSHELAEAVTDPNVGLNEIGWYDFRNNGEIADLANGRTSTITGPNGTYVVSDVVNKQDQVITPTTSSSGGNTGGGNTGGGNTGGGNTGGGNTGGGNRTLSAPKLTASAVSSTVAQLNWSAVSGTQGYKVYLVTSGGQDDYLGTVGAGTTSVDVTGLAAGSSDSFMIAAYNRTSTADSSVVSVTLPTPVVPAAVTAPVVTATALSSTSVQLNWNAESQATGFNIYWSDGYSVEFLGTVSGSTTSVTVTGLAPGSGSYFLVEAFNNTSYADSSWVYIATPQSTSGSYSFFAQYAGYGFGGESFGGYSPSIGTNAAGYQGGRERW